MQIKRVENNKKKQQLKNKKQKKQTKHNGQRKKISCMPYGDYEYPD